MENSLIQSLNELVTLQRQQVQKMNDLSVQQAEQLNLQKQQSMKSQNPMQGGYGGSRPYQGGNYGSSYNDYAPNYMPPMFDTYGRIRNQSEQFNAYAKNLNAKSGNYGLIDTFLPSYNVSRETRNMMVQDYAGRSASAAISGAGVLGSTAFSLGTYGALGFLGGTVAGIAGAPLVTAFFDNANEQGQVQTAYSKYLQRESYRFINSAESNNPRGLSGFSLNESQKAADWLRNSNSQFQVTDSQMMSLLQGYTESGLLRDVADLQTFKDKMTELTKSVKTGATILNETYESISNLMSEMKSMGISSGDYSSIMGAGKVLGSGLGISGSEMVRTILGQAGGMVSGTGLSSTQYVGRISDTTAYMTHLYNSLDQATGLDTKQQSALNYIKNNGGVTGVSSMINQIQDNMLYQYKDVAAAFYDYDKSSDVWTFNQSRYNQMMNGVKKGSYNMNDLYDMGTSNLEKYGDYAIKDWQDNYHLYLGNELDQYQVANFTQALTTAQNRLLGTSDTDYDTALSLMMKNLSPDQRALYANYLNTVSSQGYDLINRQNTLAGFETLSGAMQANRRTLLGDIKYGWEDFKEGVGDWGADVSNWFSDKYQGFNDWYYGKSNVSMNFTPGTSWSFNDMQSQQREFYDEMKGTMDTLKTLQGKGFNISSDVIDLFNVSDPNKRTFEYDRQVITNGSSLSGIVGQNYDSLSQIAEKEDLSETILAALLKFSTRSEGKALFGADKSTIAEIAKNNSLNVLDPNTASLTNQLQLAAEKISDLMKAYGGNEDLAMKAFYGGQGSVDQQLRAMGYDVDKLRTNGSQSSLYGIDTSKIVSNNNYNTYTSLNNSGYDASNTGLTYNVTGSLAGNSSVAYSLSDNYLRGTKFSAGSEGDSYYDMIQMTASQLGISPNSLASLISAESGGKASAIGGSGDTGLTQVVATDSVYKRYYGKSVQLNNGQSYTIGTTSDAAGLIGAEGIRMELMRPEVAAFIGGDIYKNALSNNYDNPYLAYAEYNGGAGYSNFIKAMATKEGLDPRSLTDSDIYNLSYKYADLAQNYGVSADTARYKGKANRDNFGSKYRSDRVIAENVTVSTYETDYEKEVVKVMRDAMNGFTVDTSTINEYFNNSDNGIGSSVMSEDVVSSIFGTFNKAASNAGTYDVGTRNSPFFALTNKLNDYESAIYNRLANDPKGYKNTVYLDKEMESQILYEIAKSSGLSIGSASEISSNADQRAKAFQSAREWYNQQYGEISKSVNGKMNSWDRLNIGTKTQTLRTMQLLSESTFGEAFGVDLGLSSIMDLVGQDYLKGYTQEQVEMLQKIDKDGVMGEVDAGAKASKYYENAVKWVEGGGKTASESIAAMAAQSKGYMGMTVADLKALLENEENNLVNNHLTSAAGIGIASGTNVSYNLTSKIGLIDQQVATAGNLTVMGDALSAFLDMDRDQIKKFRKSMGYDYLSQDSSEFEKGTVSDLVNGVTKGYDTLIETLSNELQGNLKDVTTQWSKMFGEDITSNEFFKGFFSTDSQGNIKIKDGNYEKLAGEILKYFGASGFGEEAGEASSSAESFSNASNDLTSAIDDFVSNAESSTEKITSAITTINDKVSQLQTDVNSVKSKGSGFSLFGLSLN